MPLVAIANPYGGASLPLAPDGEDPVQAMVHSGFAVDRGAFTGALKAAVGAKIAQHAAEKGNENIAPGLQDMMEADAKGAK